MTGYLLAGAMLLGVAPTDLWVLKHDDLSPADAVLAQTVQGLANRSGAHVWLDTGGMSSVILKQLDGEGTKLHRVETVWQLVDRYRSNIKGAVVYKLGDGSVNAATSVCGVLSGVAVDESLLEKAMAERLKVIYDARGKTDEQVFSEFKFARSIAVEQDPAKLGHLRDFAVARKAFCYWARSAAFRTEVAKTLGPNALVYGWGPDEYQWVRDLSKGGGAGIGADWCVNLSGMAQIGSRKSEIGNRAATRPPIPDTGRVVAFVMSDGDNIQWDIGGMPIDPKYYASPLRGKFAMTWETAPVLSEVAPRVLEYLYDNATQLDGFVAGPSGAGYTFPSINPNRAGFAEQTAKYVKKAGLDIVSVLNSGGGLPDTKELLDRPEVAGVIYKDYEMYNRHNGEIWWHNGKPCVAYKFLLWEGLGDDKTPNGVADAVAKMPSAPKTNPGSYALVNVHAWSWASIGGPMEAIKRCIDRLPPGTHVVTANELIWMLRDCFGKVESKRQSAKGE